MKILDKLPAINEYYKKILEMQEETLSTQIDILDAIADKMASTIFNKGKIFIFGTGHSHMMMEEAFYRAGGTPAAVPIFLSSLMLHENANLSSRMERLQGLADPILDQYHTDPGDIIFIYSNSGVNQLPVEMALKSKERHLTVIAVLSKAYAKIAPLSSLKKRLYEISDYTIDNFGLPGDAIVEIKGHEWRVGSSSTIIGALIWNSLLAEAITRLNEMTNNLPVFASFNLQGAEQHNKAILSEWANINPHLPEQ